MCSVLFVALRRRTLYGDATLDSSGDHLKQHLAAAVTQFKIRIRNSRKSTVRAVVDPWIRWRGRKVGPVFDRRIQELDGGFFEKFGTLLKEQATQNTAEVIKDEETVTVEDTEAEEYEKAKEEEARKKDLITESVGLNIEELYSEVLYEILHIVGCDVNDSNEQNELFLFLQKAFKLDPNRHFALLEEARSKEAPNIHLNVEVIEAKELKPKDANGLSDPFCTLFLTSAPAHRYNTSVKDQTLSPVWEEHFSLPVENSADDILCIEVWDFDPAETLSEKMTKFSEVKGVKGLRKLMKEIAVTASTGKHDNELIGSATVQLKCVPASGQTIWVHLEKKGKVKRQGLIKLKLAFGSEKNSQVAAQEHRHLLRIFLLHEMETSQIENGEWCGKFSESAETILRQHLAQSSLGPTDEALAQWVEYSNVHVTHTLDFALFADILQKLMHPMTNGLLSEEETKMFWDATKKLLPTCYNNIKKIRKLTPGDKKTITHLTSVLSVLANLSRLQPPEGTDLFPASVYGWLTTTSDGPNCDIKATLSDAVTQAAVDWFTHIVEHNKPEDNTDEAQLKQQIKIIQLIRTDLQRAIEFHDKIFYTICQFPYAKAIYTLYECKISEICEPLVTDVCMTLKPLKFKDQAKNGEYENDPLAMGTTLFELYLILQRFAVLGLGLCPGEVESFHIQKFHQWFHRGVAQWLDIAVYKALQRIEKAVELDELVPVDSTVKYSSSAVDTLAIFYQIKIFWKQLAWPDVEGSYTFVAKIMDDICRCSVYYADIMSRKVDQIGIMETVYEKKFEVTNEWCLAINNIDYVRQSIHPFVKELGMDDIIKALADFKSPSAAEHCRDTLQLVMDNAIETVRNKILDLLEIVAEKMSPAMNRFLMEGAELLNQDNNSVDRLMQYLDDNLTTLHSQLNPDNFERILLIIFSKLSSIMYDLVETSLEKRRPPSFFSNLYQTLHILIGFFKQGDKAISNDEVLSRIERMLSLHGMETTDLIHQIHLERLAEQRAMINPTYGMLTVRLQFVHDTLRIEVMNARNLHPMDNNGSCDPYVKIHILPEEKFAGITKPRTKTHKRNLFPLFDESFTVQLTPEQRQTKDALLLFIVKDQDFLGMRSEFVAEAYFPFSEISSTTMETGLEEMAQIHLKLSRPSKFDSDAVKALDHRQGEKFARDFMKRQRAKQTSTTDS